MVIEGSGFLYNMVRIIAGTLTEVGMGRRKAEELSGIVAAADRDAAGKTAAAHGLYLETVMYQS
jgi:tRNA pseudouridine38-40 synthase